MADKKQLPEGEKLKRRIAKWAKREAIEFDPHEAHLLEQLYGVADQIEILRNALVEISPHEAAYTRIAGELRQQRVTFGRIVGQLGLPTGVPVEDSGETLSAKSRNGTKGAAARWHGAEAQG